MLTLHIVASDEYINVGEQPASEFLCGTLRDIYASQFISSVVKIMVDSFDVLHGKYSYDNKAAPLESDK